MSLVLIIMRKETGRGGGRVGLVSSDSLNSQVQTDPSESEGQASSAKALQYSTIILNLPVYFVRFFSSHSARL